MMTDNTENTILDTTSIQQCEKLAGNADLQGKRAKALLELNNGESNRVAAEKSGLTTGQVSYLLGRFKKVGMALFNAKVVKKAAIKKAVVKKAVTKKAVPKKATQAISKVDATDTKPTPVAGEPVIADDVDKQLTSEPATTGDKKKKKKGKKSSKKDKAKKDSNKTRKDKKGKKSKKGKKKKSNKNKK